MANPLGRQRDVSRLLLAELGDVGFALAGSGAIREHGLTSRPTEDVDLFAATPDPVAFDSAVSRAVALLRNADYEVALLRRAPLFARMEITDRDGGVLQVDMGVDWRAQAPTVLDLGPVLALEDAVGNKVGALYSRAETRDYLDVDAIRESKQFTDARLLQLAADHDPGFDTRRFAEQLRGVRRLHPRQVEQYGVDADQLAQLQTRLNSWADGLTIS